MTNSTLQNELLLTVKNMNILADWIEKNLTPSQLNMATYRSTQGKVTLFYNKNECGAAGCLLGWCLHAFDLNPDNYRIHSGEKSGVDFDKISIELFPTLDHTVLGAQNCPRPTWFNVFGGHLSNDLQERVEGLREATKALNLI